MPNPENSTNAYRVIVMWSERTRTNGREHALTYAKTYSQGNLDDAKVFRARALTCNGWAPEFAHDIEIELLGPGIEPSKMATAEEHRAGLRQIPIALAKAKGPLLATMGKVA